MLMTHQHQKVGLEHGAHKRIYFAPLIEGSALLAELAIPILKTDLDETPDERFSIVPVYVLDFAFQG